MRRQRLAAYAVCVREGAVLLSQLSRRTSRPGSWTLPGGGVDHGEHPRDAVLREVHEETGLAVEVGRLLDVDSVHFVGRAPNGVLEDYHSVRLVFGGTVTGREEPRVVEVGGSTAAAAWVDLRDVRDRRFDVVELVHTGLLVAGHRAPGTDADGQTG